MKVKLMVQIAIVFGFCLLGEAVAQYMPVPFPASVTAMLLLLVLLLAGLLRVEHVQEKTDFLLKNMPFFFIPASVGVMEYFDVLRRCLLPLLAVCFITTIATFFATSFTVRAVSCLQRRLTRRGEAE